MRKRFILSHLASDAAGNVSVIFAVSAVLLLAVSGTAIDYVTTSANQTTLQGVLDSATLAGMEAGGSHGARIAAAAKHFAANAKQLGFTVSAPTFTFSADGKQLTGGVTFQSSASFLTVFAIQPKEIIVSSTAAAETKAVATCLHALNMTSSSALIYNNKRGPLTYTGASMVAPNCAVQVNSSSSQAVNIKETTGYNFKNYCIVGGISGSSSTLSPAPDGSCKTPVSDPLASMPLPAAAATCSSKSFASTSTTLTVTPGTYCGGLALSKANIVFDPGVYHIRGGDLSLAASASITGAGVTFVMQPGAGAIKIVSQGTIDLTAPDAGSTSGFLIMDRTGSAKNHLIQTSVRDSSWMALNGVIYAPEDHVELFWQRVGVAPNERPLSWSKFSLIADTMDLHGYNQLFIDPADLSAIAPSFVASGGGQKGGIRLVR